MTNGDLQSIGEMLRAARESRALSLEEAEAQTRIRVKFLRALEEGDISMLPSTTHARGFLRNYAQFLRLDVAGIVARFDEATGTTPRPITQVTAQPFAFEAVPPAQDQLPVGAEGIPFREEGGSSVGELAAAEAGESVGAEEGEPASTEEGWPAPTEAESSPRPDVPPAAPPTRAIFIPPGQRAGPGRPLTYRPASRVAAVPETPGSARTRPQAGRREPGSPAARVLRSNLFVLAMLVVGAVAVVWWATSRLSAIPGDELVPVTQSSDFLEQLADNIVVTPSPTFRPTSTPEPESGPEFLDRVVLAITVSQRTWTRIDVDGATVFEGPNKPGEVLRYEGQEEILVRTGNGAALEVVYNGQDIGPLGERGEVVERFFTVSGQLTPTPTPTLTPTNTGVPTPTPRFTPTPEREQ